MVEKAVITSSTKMVSPNILRIQCSRWSAKFAKGFVDGGYEIAKEEVFMRVQKRDAHNHIVIDACTLSDFIFAKGIV